MQLKSANLQRSQWNGIKKFGQNNKKKNSKLNAYKSVRDDH